MCRKKDFATVPNKQNERAVKYLHVFCTNKGRGCDWQGEVKNITGHLSENDGCRFERVNCSNKCGLTLERRYLSKHIDKECPRSEITCQYCSITGERQFINSKHQEQCPKFPLPCPNNCDIGMVLRENMEAHKAECPLEIIPCEYHEVGCKESMARKDKTEHDKKKMEDHLCLMKSEYLCTKRTLADTEKMIKELQSTMERTVKQVEIHRQQIFKHVFQWYTTLEQKAVESSQNTPQVMPVTLKVSEYSKQKKWCSTSFIWPESMVFQQYPKFKLQVIPAGFTNGKRAAPLSVRLYLVKGGCKVDYAHMMSDNSQNFGRWFSVTPQQISENHQYVQHLQNSACNQKLKIASFKQKIPVGVMILNQISDSEHLSLQNNQVAIQSDFFCTNKDCQVLIFDCLVPNEVMCRSTATCRYLNDDNLYFLVKEQ